MSGTRNISASVRQRLLNRSKADGRSFNELLQYYAMERFLYRLSLSDHAQNFILKGALTLRAWNSPEFRPTMDIDLLGITGNDEENIIAQIRDILAVEVEPDGLTFDSATILAEPITEEADYKGTRLRFRCVLDTARVMVQIDIGFGDIVYPASERVELPCMLDFPPPLLLCYSRESAIAEKFEAMVKLGRLNSRMKDFFDIWLLSRRFKFDAGVLTAAVKLTFEQRGSDLSEPVEAFTEAFITSHQAMWQAFRKRLKQEFIPQSFREVVESVEAFLKPVVKSAQSELALNGDWNPGEGWHLS